MISTVLLDVDGVLTDFLRSALYWHKRPELCNDYPRGVWNTPKVLGISETEFWRSMDCPEFWSQLPCYKGSAEFLSRLWHATRVTNSHLAFCTRSAYNVGAFAEARVQKLRNLSRAAGIASDIPLYIAVHGGKGVFGRPDHLLIDDYDQNVQRFTESDGQAILVPMPWNCLEGEEPEGCRVSMAGPDYVWLTDKVNETLGV